MTTNKDKIRAASQKYLQKGQIDRAIRELENLLHEDPTDIRTMLRIGELQIRQKNTAAATQIYRTVANTYASQGFFLKSVAVYKQILKLDDSLIDIHVSLAELYHQLGLVADAVHTYHRISELYEKASRWDDNISVLTKLVDLDPANLPARIKLADTYSHQGRLDEAKRNFALVAKELKNANRLSDYAAMAERLLLLDPSDVQTARELAEIYINKGDPARALPKLQMTFRANPKDVDILNLLARAFTELGEKQKAASVYQEMSKIFGDGGNRVARDAVLRKLASLEGTAINLTATNTSWPKKDGTLAESIRETSPINAIEEIEEVIELPENSATQPPLAEAEPVENDGFMLLTEQHILKTTNEPATPNTATLENEEPIDPLLQALVEADTYIKYGLREKAIHHLEKLLVEHPHLREAQERYTKLLIDSDQVDLACEVLWDMAIQAQQADNQTWMRKDLQEILRIQPNHQKAADLLATSRSKPLVEKPSKPQMMLSTEEVEIDIELDTSENWDDKTPLTGQFILTPLPSNTTAESNFSSKAPDITNLPADLTADLAEATFFIQQDLIDEARDILQRLQADHPNHPQVISLAALLPQQTNFKTLTGPEIKPHADMHDELGRAYQEMGLFNDAIHEFKLLQNDPHKRVHALIMIGLCHMEMKAPKEALPIFLAGLNTPQATPEEQLTLRYEIGLTFETLGQLANALKFYTKVAAIDPKFRDIDTRLKHVQQLSEQNPTGENDDSSIDFILP